MSIGLTVARRSAYLERVTKRLFVAVLFLSALAAGHAWPQTRAKLNVVYPAISGINAALWFAAETMTFEKHGLEVKLIYIPTALQVTPGGGLTGDSQITFSGGTPVLNAALGGAANVPAFYMMALREIKTVADLKGKSVGGTRFGSSTDFAMRYLLPKQGLNPDKDVTVLQLGGMPELAAALSKRLIAAAPLSAPTHIRARSAGAQPLIDLAKAGVYFPHTAVITTRGYLKANPDHFVDNSVVKSLEEQGFFRQIGMTR